MKNKELEFKYSAEDIPREDFDAFCKSLAPVREWNSEDTESVDYYFTSKETGRFMRFRVSNGNWELTSKVKLSEKNNNVRTEVNIKLGKDMDLEKAQAFAEIFGLEQDFSIKKDVQVYWYENMVLSHYTCLSLDNKVLNTFMEIECDEEYDWPSEEIAMEELREWEKKCSPLGLSAQKRIKKSLFEFYTTF